MARRIPSRFRSYRLPISADGIAALARTLVSTHAEWIASGYELMGSSAVWRNAEGELTARFVYRKRSCSGRATITYLLKGIAI